MPWAIIILNPDQHDVSRFRMPRIKGQTAGQTVYSKYERSNWKSDWVDPIYCPQHGSQVSNR